MSSVVRKSYKLVDTISSKNIKLQGWKKKETTGVLSNMHGADMFGGQSG